LSGRPGQSWPRTCARWATLRPQIAAEARDAAILALGWSAALRRSELVGLDWQKLGEGAGYLLVDERGIVITLARSKSAQSEAVIIVVPCTDMPAACEAVARWAQVRLCFALWINVRSSVRRG
jgi:site-specific recombinase XerC